MLLVHDAETSRAIQVALAAGTYVVAFLMISPFPYWSFKNMAAFRRRPFLVALAVVSAAVVSLARPATLPFLLFVAYAVSGPLGRLRSRGAWSPSLAAPRGPVEEF